MTLVEQVLEMLRLHLPGFEVRPGDWSRGCGPGPEPDRDGPDPGRPQDAGRQARRRWRGRPHRRPEDPELARCYAELEVPYGADWQQVHRAWRRLVRRHHPDLHAADRERQEASCELVKRYNRAYDELGRRLRRQRQEVGP